MTERTPKAQKPLNDGAEPAPWIRARQHLADGDRYWLTTLRPDGTAHAAPVLAVWLDGALHFSTSPTSRKGRNLAAEPRCVIALGDEEVDLVVEGEAVRVTDETTLHRVAAVYATKYDWRVEIRDGAFYADGAPTAGPPPFHVHAVAPALVFGFPVSGSMAATRWRF